MVLNPYPYIKQANCVVVSSDFEGYSIAVKEALFLGKAMISTDVSGVREIFDNEKYGIVSEIDTDALCEKMEKALSGEIDLSKIEDTLTTFNGSNDLIKRRLFSMIEGNLKNDI